MYDCNSESNVSGRTFTQMSFSTIHFGEGEEEETE